MPQLGLPQELTAVLRLLQDHLGDHVPRMHVNGANGHDLLSVVPAQLAQQQSYQ